MIKDKKKKNKIRKKRVRTILLCIIVLFISFKILPVLHASKVETYTVEKGKIEITKKAEGIIFRDETVYKASSSGIISYVVKEGERVGVSDEVADISINTDTDKLKEELKSIEDQIKNLTNNNISKNLFQKDIAKNQEYIDSLLKEIQSTILNGDYKKASELRGYLDKALDKQNSLTGQKGYNASSITQLQERYDRILEEIQTSNITYYADRSGIISYNIDNLEMIYVPEKLDELYPKNLKKIDENVVKQFSGKKVKPGEQIYKIIDNYKWYIAVRLHKDDVYSIKEGGKIELRLNNSDDIIDGDVYKINRGNNQAVIIISLNKKLYKFYNQRFIDVEIILDSYEGLKIPSKSIVERDGIKGVYIKGIGGITRFRGVNILGYNNEYTIVEEGTGLNKSFIKINKDGKNETIETLSIYDELIINSDGVKEGDIIN